MSQVTVRSRRNFFWASSKWRLVTLAISLVAIYFLRNFIPDFQLKTTFTVQSIYAAVIAIGVAIIGLISFSLFLHFLIGVLKWKIDFHPDDYNVSSDVGESLTTPSLRLPFILSGFLINPLGEELFFRMLILGGLSSFINPWAALCISVVVYYLFAHKTWELMEFVIIAVIGVITSYLYLEYSVWHAFAANGGFVAGIYATTAVFNRLDSKNQAG